MDVIIEELHLACRRGDLEQVRSLVTRGAPINAIDKMNYTPLVISSLCGHLHIVQYLLANGVRCDRDTFEGERAIYAALNDKIRRVLIDSCMSIAVDFKQPFASYILSFLEGVSLLASPMPGLSDLQVSTLKIHSLMLAIRSGVARKLLSSQPLVSALSAISVLMNAKDGHVVEPLLRHIYFVDETFDVQYRGRIQSMADEWDIDLVDGQSNSERILNAITYHKSFVEENVLKYECASLQEAVSAGLCSDIVLHVAIDDGESIFYPAHKMMLVASEFYHTALTSEFLDNASNVLKLNVPTKAVAQSVIRFLYYDEPNVPIDVALDVLYAADELLLERLKIRAANAIIADRQSPTPTYIDIYEILAAAWDTRVSKLEYFAAEVFAQSLDEYIEDEEFLNVLKDSASRITERQTTDTIELLDDIRYHLGQIYLKEKDVAGLTASERKAVLEEADANEELYNLKVDQLDALLDKLGLDA